MKRTDLLKILEWWLEYKRDSLHRPDWPPIVHPGPLETPAGRRKRIGLAGFEPTASSSRTRRATRLRYSPLVGGI